MQGIERAGLLDRIVQSQKKFSGDVSRGADSTPLLSQLSVRRASLVLVTDSNNWPQSFCGMKQDDT